MLGSSLECQTHHVLLLNLCISGLEYSTGIISFKPVSMLCRLLSVISSCWSLWRTMCGCVLLWSLVQALDILSLAGWLIKWWIFMNTATDLPIAKHTSVARIFYIQGAYLLTENFGNPRWKLGKWYIRSLFRPKIEEHILR